MRLLISSLRCFSSRAFADVLPATYRQRRTPPAHFACSQGTVQLSRKAVAAVMRDPSSLRLLAQPAAGGAQPGSPGAPAAAPAAAAAAASELPSAHFGGISVERLIWDLERSSAVVRSG